MKKILIVAGGFYPAKKYGGPVVSIDNLCTLLSSSEFKFYVIASEHDLFDAKRLDGISEGWNNRGNCKVMYLADRDFSFSKFIKILKEVNPQMIYINSLFDFPSTPLFLIISKLKKCPLLLAPRGQLCAGAFKKSYKKIPYIIFLKLFGLTRHVYFQATSEEEFLSIRKYFRNCKKDVINLSNVPSIVGDNLVYPDKKKGAIRLIFISRIHPKKNLKFVLNLLNNFSETIYFDIYGPIEDEQYWNECLEIIRDLSNNIYVQYCGILDHADVAKILIKYDCFVFPTLSENYGHVIAEALSTGTPVIISDQTPWKNLENYFAGFDLSLEDTQQWINALKKLIYMDADSFTIYRRNVKSYFRKEINLDALKKTYEQTFEKICGE